MERFTRGHLSLEDRQIISSMSERGCKDSEIGRVLGRDRSVIWRERRRNRAPLFLSGSLTALERAKWSHDKARRRRSDSKRVNRTPLNLVVVREQIQQLLSVHYSPESISDRLGQSDLGVVVSGRTIRRWIHRYAPELRKDLPERGKRRRTRVTRRANRRKADTAAAQKRNISTRPSLVDLKTRVGDLEADTLFSRKSKVAILSVQDRGSRRRWYRKLANLESATVHQALVRLVLEIPPELRRTITFDNGGEFAAWQKLERLTGIQTYFCDPYSAWQKGAVERSNKELRRFLPKGTDFALVTEQQLSDIELALNQKPMKCLDKLCALQSWKVHSQAYLH